MKYAMTFSCLGQMRSGTQPFCRSARDTRLVLSGSKRTFSESPGTGRRWRGNSADRLNA